MPEPVPFTYRAFLSYSHRDKTWAAWLHRALERTRIDKDLVGRETPVGPVPATLQPIFRDRDDFSAGHSLTEQTLAALQGSQFIVAICSPNAARSPYVNEEIRCFKAMGRGDRIIPLIVDGEPGDPQRECFPPALRFKLKADGTVGTEPEEPIAADARPQGDGKDAALVKITAGLLGVRLDEVIRRAARARARHRRVVGSIIGAFLLLIVGGSSALAWGYYKSLENDSLMDEIVRVATGFVTDATTMSNKLGIPASVPLALLTRADAALSGYIAKGKDSPKLRYRRAQTLLEIADNYAKLGQTPQRMQRVTEARALLEKLVEEGPRNGQVLLTLATAYNHAADVMLARGDARDEVLAEYRKALAIREDLLEKNPDHEGVRNDLGISYERIADLLLSQNKLAEAAETVNALVALRERLAAEIPHDLYAQQNLAIAYDRAAHIAYDRGLIDEAIRGYRRALAITEKLVAAAPTDTTYLRNLGVAHNALAQTLASQADLDGALTEANAGLEVRKRLAASDPTNAIWQLDLTTSYETLGNLYWVRSDLPKHSKTSELAEALTNYRAAYTIRQKLEAADPSNVDTRRSLSVARGRLASTLAALGNLDEALALHRENLAAREKLAADLPSSVRLQLDLSLAYWSVGDLLLRRKAYDEALQYYEKGRAIAEAIVKVDSGNVTQQRQLAFFYQQIGVLQEARGDKKGAIEAYRKCAEIRTALASANPAVASLAMELVLVRRALLTLGDEPAKQLEQLVVLQQRLLDAGQLPALVTRDVASDYAQLGELHRGKGEVPLAIKAYQGAVGVLQRIAATSPRDASVWIDLAKLHFTLTLVGENSVKQIEDDLEKLRQLGAQGLLTKEQQDTLGIAETELAKLKS